MRTPIGLFILFISLGCFGQMYVSPNSYVYANDRVVYVTQNINIQNNGNIYLRNESQLLQGTAGASTNLGIGKLSVFQEGTSDNFDYNYWCSPVGNASAAVGNENFGITMLNMPTGLVTSTPAVMLSATALDGLASPLSIAPRWIYKYINSNLYPQWIQAASTTTIAAGEGFTMKGTSGSDATTVQGVQNNPGGGFQRYDFRGKPNDGNIFVTVGANNQTLTGNPYPSALHVNAFLLDAGNTACDGIAYYWEQNKATNSHYLLLYQGGYGTYSPINLASNGLYVPATFDTYDSNGNLNTTGTSSGLVIERKYAPIGQGFMVKGTAPGVLTLKNAHRTYYKESLLYSQFERQTMPDNSGSTINSVPHFRLNAILNDQYTRQIALALIPEATDDVDRGIDAMSPNDDDLPNDVYFHLNNAKYVIQGIAFDVNQRIPVGVKSDANSTFRFYIPEVVNFDNDQAIYIYDGQDGSYHNLKNGFYEVTLDAGIYNERFEITFLDAALNVPHLEDSQIQIVQDNNLQFLNIANPAMMDLQSCTIYDMAGKKVMSRSLTVEPSYSVSTSSLSEGVYIVKITSLNGENVNRKFSVFRLKN